MVRAGERGTSSYHQELGRARGKTSNMELKFAIHCTRAIYCHSFVGPIKATLVPVFLSSLLFVLQIFTSLTQTLKTKICNPGEGISQGIELQQSYTSEKSGTGHEKGTRKKKRRELCGIMEGARKSTTASSTSKPRDSQVGVTLICQSDTIGSVTTQITINHDPFQLGPLEQETAGHWHNR